jgi:hypothetical protein
MRRSHGLVLIVLAALAGAAGWQLAHGRPLRVRIVRNGRAANPRTERTLREVVADLGDAVADMAADAPSRVAVALPWEVLCPGERDASCAEIERDQMPDVTLVVTLEAKQDEILGLRIGIVGVVDDGSPIDVTWTGGEGAHWGDAVARVRRRLGLPTGGSRTEEPGVTANRRLVQAALAGTLAESTTVPLAPRRKRWWPSLSWTRRRDAAATPEALVDFVGRYAAAWSSGSSDAVASLQTAMTAGERADVERYLAAAPHLVVEFSDVSSVAHGSDVLVSAWRTDRFVSPRDGRPLTLRSHVVLQLRRQAEDWVVTEQGRPDWLRWAPRPPAAPFPRPALRPPPGPVPARRPTPPSTTTTTLPDLQSLPRWRTDPSSSAPIRQRGLSVDEIADLAFGPGALGHVPSWRQPPWFVATGAPGFDARSVLPLLDAAYRLVRRDFPFLGDASEPAVLLVFDTRAAQQRFLARLADRIGARFDFGNLPGVGGEAIFGIGTTWVEDIAPAGLPTICLHEAVHALTAQLFGIDRVASWFSEGLARRAELVILDPDVDDRVRAMLARDEIPPLAELMNAAHIPAHGYLPAALLIDWLLADPLRQSQLPQLFRDARAERRPDLLALLQRRMGLGADALERQWREWLQRRFG